MLDHLTIACQTIIGQSGENVSRDLGRLLAALRVPLLLPEGVNAFLFEAHWSYWILLVVVAGTLFYVGVTRADRRMKIAGIAGIAVLVVWIIAAGLIETPRERLYGAHTGLAQAAKDGDTDRILSYLSADFRAPALGLNQAGAAREKLRGLLKEYGIGGSTITAYRADISGRAAFTGLSLITQTDAGGPIATSWNLSWDDVEGADWKIKEADLVKVGDQRISGEGALPGSLSNELLK